MSDKEARAVAAGETIEVNGSTYKISPLSFQQLQDIQKEALSHYKRQYLETFKDNADILGDDFLAKKAEQAARWDTSDLPKKEAHDVSNVPAGDELVELLSREYDDVPPTDAGRLALLSSALDRGNITPQQVEVMTGVCPEKRQVPYDAWWATSTYEGILSLVWRGLKKDNPQITRDEVGAWPISKLTELASVVEKMTEPALENT